MQKVKLFTDGGARGNPGPAGIGVVLKSFDSVQDDSGGLIQSRKAYIGETTNNQAEYKALIMGLEMAWEAGYDQVQCYLDSELVVKQLNGEYKMKNPGLKPLFAQVDELKKNFAQISFHHIPREENKEADALVNEALDEHQNKSV